MKLLHLLVILVALIFSTVSAAYEVYFIGDSSKRLPLYIDKNKKAELKACRYNSTGRLYCEVYMNVSGFRQVTNCGGNSVYINGVNYGPGHSCTTKNEYYDYTNHYRIHMKVDVRNFGSECKKVLTNGSTFSSYKLYYNGKEQNQFADRESEVAKGTLPEHFGTYKNRKYTFELKKGKCTFYTDFVSIDGYTA